MKKKVPSQEQSAEQELVQAGEIQALVSDSGQQSLYADSSVAKRLINSGVDIKTNPASIQEAVFNHAVLCQVGFPRKKTEAREFVRESGNASLKLFAGELWNGKEWVKQPLPYGPTPRLVLTHISSMAVKRGNPCVEVGDSVHEFLKMIKFDTGGKSYSRFRQQIQAVSACRFMIGMTEGNRARTVESKPIKEFEAWINDEAGQRTMWPSTITLSAEFFESLRHHAVPLDTRALGALKHSALALDIYTWLAYRLCQIREPSGIRITWQALKDQFGQEYGEVRKFKQNFESLLKQVLLEYRDAKVSSLSSNGGLLLKYSPPPIPKKMIQVIETPAKKV